MIVARTLRIFLMWCAVIALQDAVFRHSKPGLLDRQNFKQHWSVDFWKDFSVPPSISDPSTPIPSR
jgi:hypothetical protein